MIILGVDSALNKTGWARVIDDEVVATGIIKPPASADRAGRLSEAYMMLRREIVGYGLKARPRFVVIEAPGRWARGKRESTQQTIEALAMARAAAILAASWYGVRSVEVDVNEARELVLGVVKPPTLSRSLARKAGSSKEVGKRWVGDLLKLRGVDPELIQDPDAADAAVVALAGYSLWKAGDYRFRV